MVENLREVAAQSSGNAEADRGGRYLKFLNLLCQCRNAVAEPLLTRMLCLYDRVQFLLLLQPSFCKRLDFGFLLQVLKPLLQNAEVSSTDAAGSESHRNKIKREIIAGLP